MLKPDKNPWLGSSRFLPTASALIFAMLGLVAGIFATHMEHVAGASVLIVAPPDRGGKL
jgi:hypothetical protein